MSDLFPRGALVAKAALAHLENGPQGGLVLCLASSDAGIKIMTPLANPNVMGKEARVVDGWCIIDLEAATFLYTLYEGGPFIPHDKDTTAMPVHGFVLSYDEDGGGPNDAGVRTAAKKQSQKYAVAAAIFDMLAAELSTYQASAAPSRSRRPLFRQLLPL